MLILFETSVQTNSTSEDYLEMFNRFIYPISYFKKKVKLKLSEAAFGNCSIEFVCVVCAGV